MLTLNTESGDTTATNSGLRDTISFTYGRQEEYINRACAYKITYVSLKENVNGGTWSIISDNENIVQRTGSLNQNLENKIKIVLNNAFLNINYIKGKFRAGLRYESYLNALADYDPEFKGNGIPFRYATYSIDGLEITAGNYYEQLGSGLIFRAYEEKD